MRISDAGTAMYFLSGGGEMGELTRSKNWKETTVGDPQFWPENLRITLSIMLNSKFPMFLWWGPDLVCFYNDAYRPSLGNEGKHPSILGMKAEEAWVEIWEIIKPLIDKVIQQGESIWFEDLLVPIFRNGQIEDVYWTFSYSPVYNNSGKVEGVLVTCTETTEKVFIKKQLEESERKLRLIITQAPVSIGIFRGTNYVTEIANAKALELWRRKEEEVLNKPILEAMPELRAQGIKKLLDEVYATGNAFSAIEFPVQLLRNGGLETAYVNFSYEPLYDGHGKIDGIMAVGIEVTDQVVAHKKVEASEEKLSIVIDASELGVFILDLETDDLDSSGRLKEIFGYTPADKLTHSQLLSHLHPDDLSVRNAAFENSSGKNNIQYESRIIWNDGSVHWIEGKGKYYYDATGKPMKLIGTVRDISEEKEQEQHLRESEMRFRTLIMESPVPKAILRGEDHVVEMANKALLKNIWRKEESEVIGRRVLDVFPELKDQKYASLLHKVYTTGEKWTEVEAFISLTGDDGLKSFYIDFEYAPLFDSEESISGIKLTAIDVTEKVEARKRAEERENDLRLLSDSLEKKVSERTMQLEEKNMDLEKMNKELQSFAYISSHDLQEPLRKIQTFATRLYDKEFNVLSEAGRDQFKRMQAAAERMQTLIDDLLAYSRTATAARKFEKVDLGKIVAELKDDLKEEIKEKHAQIETGELCEVTVIPFQFRQLLQNLVGNALKFSSPERLPVIKITSSINDGSELSDDTFTAGKKYCHIVISDNGIGFEQQYHDKIFELFQRLHGKGEFSGTGIGLSIVKKIVDNHHGIITVKGELNKGATFEIFLPVEQNKRISP
jgi:PAS domain S-box-containing protein